MNDRLYVHSMASMDGNSSRYIHSMFCQICMCVSIDVIDQSMNRRMLKMNEDSRIVLPDFEKDQFVLEIQSIGHFHNTWEWLMSHHKCNNPECYLPRGEKNPLAGNGCRCLPGIRFFNEIVFESRLTFSPL